MLCVGVRARVCVCVIQSGRVSSDAEGLKREADRLAAVLREAREREAVLRRELAEGRPEILRV
jgi:hypothetical protein